MADGIVTVLREYECNCSPPGGEVMCVPCRAADEIERLRAQVAQQRTGKLLLQVENLTAALKDLLGMVTTNLTPSQVAFLPGMKQAVTAAKEALGG